jgi:CubicO group peptidase (beta-lactamase class C family)
MLWASAVAPASIAAAGPRRPSESNWQGETDRIVQSMMHEHEVPGVMLAVVRAGEVAYQKGYGVKRVPDGGLPDANTVFYIGSLSKALTAVGAMLLVQDGKLDLGAPGSRYIRDLPRAWRAITVRQFMTHTSGIPEIPNREKKAEPSIHEVYGLMSDQPVRSAPGKKQQYDNFNFAVTGNLIETISGQSYIEFMTARVFKPLGMDRSGIGTIDSDNRAYGYARGKKGKTTETKPDIAAFGVPSGGLETTAADLLKLDASLRGHTLLQPRFFTMMVTPADGFTATPGWFTRSAGNITVVSKNGAAGGFSSFFAFTPRRHDAIIMLRNVQAPGAGIQEPCNTILASCCGIPNGSGGDDSNS